ncbi:MAG TPA: hypothetical protein O0W90_03745 [Methanocorpusculum sp.]|nr:hypothetical protein [Methanocorpusculum sp.]
MILHDAVNKLKEVSEGTGTEDGDLIYRYMPNSDICRYCTGEAMTAEFGGRAAEISTPKPFSAKMRLENLFSAPLKSEKTRAAAAGALSAAAGFLMLTRKTHVCSNVFFEDCLNDLVRKCLGKTVYIIGNDIPGLSQSLTADDADLVIITGDGLLDDDYLEEIDEVFEMEKEVLFVGPSCAGVAALLQKPLWCPYST